MKQFYIDLPNWIESINQKSQELSPDDYWKYIFESAEVLKGRYNNHELIANVVSVHINYLIAVSDDLPF